MAYKSLLASTPEPATDKKTGRRGYTSLLDGSTTFSPTSQELTVTRKKKKDEEDKQHQIQVEQTKKNSLLSKVKSGAKSVGKSLIASEQTAATGIARSLPGGTADLDAQAAARTRSEKDFKSINDQIKNGHN
jgi:hypothetical protein